MICTVTMSRHYYAHKQQTMKSCSIYSQTPANRFTSRLHRFLGHFLFYSDLDSVNVLP